MVTAEEVGGRRRAGLGMCLALLACSCGHEPPTQPPLPVPPPDVGLACGTERWPVKTLSDRDALAVDVTGLSSSVSLLNRLASHCDGGPNERRTYAEERQVFEVVARVTLVRGEADHDVHMALADLATGETMVVEVVDPGCTGAAGSPHRDQIAQARAAFNVFSGNRPFAELRGAMVRVRGVGFFDFDHGQTGRSRSCFELHPVLDIQRVDF